nr:reverse transcriptase domain-containing protein [Tanacetum cinerariifolium]
MVTKLSNETTNFRQRPDESLFKAWERYKLSIDCFPNHNMLPVTQIDTFYNEFTLRHRDTINAAAGGTFMKRRPEECYDLIKNMTAHHNDWDTFVQRSESSSHISSSFDPEIVALKAEMEKINKNLMKVLQFNQQVKAVTHNCETYGGPHSYNDCPATVGQTQNIYDARAYNQGGNSYQPQGASHGQNQPTAYQEPAYQTPGYQAPVQQPSIPQPQVMNTASSLGLGTLPSNTITNPKKDLKGITTQSGNAYQGPTIPTTSSSLPKVVERETEVTKDTVPPTNNRSTKDVQPSIVQIETPVPNSEPVVALVVKSVVAPVSAPNLNQKLSIPYPSRLHDQKLRDKTNDQKEKFFQIFQDLNFNISFVDALNLMPKFGPTIKSLLTNKEKLFELARTPLNEHCSAVLLKKLPEKLGDPGKFLIPCDFSRMDECLALADLDARINLMPLSVWNKLSFLELSPMCMNLELADRSISRLVRVAEDVFVKTGRALIDVYDGELTLCVGKEAVTFNLDQTSRYSANYDAMSVNRIDLIDVACEEYSQEVLGFFTSGNPTLSTKPIVSNSSPTLTCLSHLDKMLKRCEDTNLCLNWEKSHFMVKKGIILGHKIYKNRIEVDKAKVDVIAKLPHPTTIKGICIFLGHVGFYRRFIQDCSKIARPMTHLLEKDTPFFFSKECIEAFQTLKKKLTEGPILVAPDWDLPFELMCDTSDFAIGAVLGQRKTKHFQPIHYASKTMTDAQAHYIATEKELLAMVYSFEKFWPYLVLSKSIMYTDHYALKYLFNKQDAKPKLLRWVLHMQEFYITVRDKKRAKNLAADHLS